MERDFLAELSASQQAPARRKRGGLAGIWDRNKNIIKPLATGIVGAIPGLGPMAAAGLGAAMGGLDRPGRGGVGLDLGGAVRGGLQGYGAGRVGEMARGGASRLLGRGATEAAGNVQRVASPMGGSVEVGRLAEGYTPGSAPMARRGLARALGGEAGQAFGMGGASGRLGRGLGATASRVLTFIRDNPEAAGMGLQAVSGIIGSQSERRIRERQEAEERRRAQNQAMFALPMYLESLRGSR